MATTLKSLAARQIEARSRARASRVRVFEIERGQAYWTPSQSEAGTEYSLFRTREGWECGCRGFLYTGSCKHLGQLERRSEREGWVFGKIAPIARKVAA
jgi:hypothetical protein